MYLLSTSLQGGDSYLVGGGTEVQKRGTLKYLPEIDLFGDLISLGINTFIKKIIGK